MSSGSDHGPKRPFITRALVRAEAVSFVGFGFFDGDLASRNFSERQYYFLVIAYHQRSRALEQLFGAATGCEDKFEAVWNPLKAIFYSDTGHRKSPAVAHSGKRLNRRGPYTTRVQRGLLEPRDGSADGRSHRRDLFDDIFLEALYQPEHVALFRLRNLEFRKRRGSTSAPSRARAGELPYPLRSEPGVDVPEASFAEICALPVTELAARDAVLWVSVSMASRKRRTSRLTSGIPSQCAIMADSDAS